MSKVLLTGGSGFVAAHVVRTLLERGHTVVATVRSKIKGDQMLAAHGSTRAERLSYVIVSDIASRGAFDKAVQSEPPFDYVIHAASPFHDNWQDPVKDVLNPAINGTTGILKAIQKYAPQVKRVVLTSSFAAIVNTASPPEVYDESSWNPITWNEAIAERSLVYRGSKVRHVKRLQNITNAHEERADKLLLQKLAEEAAWKFMENEKPNFDLVTMNPPLVYGPIAHHLKNLDGLNTSNTRIRDFVQGKVTTNELPPTGTYLFVDVRDLALAHVRAIEVPEAGSKRFFIVGGHCSHKRIVDAIKETYPELTSKLPKDPIDDFPADVYGYDNSRAREVLGIEFRSLRECIGDTTASLLGAIEQGQ